MWLKKIVCALFGHREPYVATTLTDICGRCNKIMFDRRTLHRNRLRDLRKRYDRVKKRGF